MSKTPKPAAKKETAASSNGGAVAEQKPAIVAAAAPEAGVNIQAPQPQPGAQPSMRILGQYLKDLSFENPNAPQSLAPQQTQPDINIAVNVNAKNLAPTDFEVELHLDAKATVEGKVVFAAELVYAGAFRLENFPSNLLHPAVLIDCPRMLSRRTSIATNCALSSIVVKVALMPPVVSTKADLNAGTTNAAIANTRATSI